MFKKICDFLAGVMIVVLAVTAGLLIIPNFLGCKSLAVLSGSMEPEIPVGAIVYVRDVDAQELEEGDVITYRLNNQTMVTHRVAEINTTDGTVTTKGDANEAQDAEPISFSNIVGKEWFHVPYLGYISIYGKTPIGIMAICGVIMVLILLIFLPDIFASTKKGNDDSQEPTSKKE